VDEDMRGNDDSSGNEKRRIWKRMRTREQMINRNASKGGVKEDKKKTGRVIE
jgi:hypothetical protein